MDRLKSSNPKVAAGLMNAIGVSQSHKEKGVVLVQYSDGSRGLMPAKSAQESIGKPTTVTRAGKSIPYVRVASIVSTSPSVFSLIPLVTA